MTIKQQTKQQQNNMAPSARLGERPSPHCLIASRYGIYPQKKMILRLEVTAKDQFFIFYLFYFQVTATGSVFYFLFIL